MSHTELHFYKLKVVNKIRNELSCALGAIIHSNFSWQLQNILDFKQYI